MPGTAEQSRPTPDLTLERAARDALPAGSLVCGVDEAGRGPIAGPVVAAAVILPNERIPTGINDSKRLSSAQRESLATLLHAEAMVGIGMCSVGEIDELNILGATMLAMRRAIEHLPQLPAVALIDGNRVPDPTEVTYRQQAIVKGDQKSLSIAAASIIAKTHRDQRMCELAGLHDGYGWDRNFGYPTPEHLSALRRLGPTEHHRRSFAPVRELVGGENMASIPDV